MNLVLDLAAISATWTLPTAGRVAPVPSYEGFIVRNSCCKDLGAQEQKEQSGDELVNW